MKNSVRREEERLTQYFFVDLGRLDELMGWKFSSVVSLTMNRAGANDDDQAVVLPGYDFGTGLSSDLDGLFSFQAEWDLQGHGCRRQQFLGLDEDIVRICFFLQNSFSNLSSHCQSFYLLGVSRCF
jgi:hypothetical protein